MRNTNEITINYFNRITTTMRSFVRTQLAESLESLLDLVERTCSTIYQLALENSLVEVLKRFNQCS